MLYSILLFKGKAVHYIETKKQNTQQHKRDTYIYFFFNQNKFFPIYTTRAADTKLEQLNIYRAVTLNAIYIEAKPLDNHHTGSMGTL